MVSLQDIPKSKHLQANALRPALITIEAVHGVIVQCPLQHGLYERVTLVDVSRKEEGKILLPTI